MPSGIFSTRPHILTGLTMLCIGAHCCNGGYKFMCIPQVSRHLGYDEPVVKHRVISAIISPSLARLQRLR